VQAEQQRFCHDFGLLIDKQPKSKSNMWRNFCKLAISLLSTESIAGPTVIAGYPWFNDWGRDTLIACPD